VASKALLTLLLLVPACHESSTAPAPDVVGTITSRAARFNAGVPQMLVQGDSPGCENSYIVYLHSVQRLRYASGAPADTSALVIGAQVRVWTNGMALTSCPGQVAAIEIEIDRPGPTP
jgi:hypothetical protein